MKNVETTIIILAAGNSSRLGSPKQLLKFKGKTLMRNVIDEALKVTQNVAVVIGDENAEILEQIQDALIIKNKNWASGMGSSVAVGLEFALKMFPQIQNCIFSVCDQPFLSEEIFTELILEKKTSDKNIVASKYGETQGVPVLFDQKYFAELLQLKGNEGAKMLLKKYADDVAAVDFEKGAIDIDTTNDYENLKKSRF